MQAAIECCSSCSQKRKTRNPSLSRREVAAASLVRFLSILNDQYGLFARGMWPHVGQPCQKQPSTKTTTRCFGKRKSGFPEIPFGRKCQPLIPCRTKAKRIRRSVVLLSLLRTAAIALLRAAVTAMNAPSRRHFFNARSIVNPVRPAEDAVAPFWLDLLAPPGMDPASSPSR